MRRLMLVVLFLSIVFAPFSAGAQSSLHLKSASVDIWPEYDQPAVLVIYHLTLAEGTPLPAVLTIHVPSRAEVSAVAFQDNNGSLLNAQYDRTVQGSWATLAITTDSLLVQVEYYDALDKTGTQRHIVFEWTGDYSSDSFEVNFLEPTGAFDVNLNPGPQSSSQGQEGLINDHIVAGSLSAGQDYTLTIDYKRLTDTLGIAGLPVQPASTPVAASTGQQSAVGVLPWVLGGLGILLIFAGVFGFVMWRRGSKVKRVRRHRTAAAAAGDLQDEDLIYCQQCGKRAETGDIFCRTCGTRLRHITEE
ncbi:MAG TPA: zinc ribbon domain-containing protein [Anaerolineales bacterium]|nr:zinc ribbon domain-containing protein [Anaerolineales bacterium]